jgi:hypothetical protein
LFKIGVQIVGPKSYHRGTVNPKLLKISFERDKIIEIFDEEHSVADAFFIKDLLVSNWNPVL